MRKMSKLFPWLFNAIL